jgi:large repetitive protein
MSSHHSSRMVRLLFLLLSCFCSISVATAQGVKQAVSGTPIADSDTDHVKERSAWFYRGRIVRGKLSAELRRRAYNQKMQRRAQRAAALSAAMPATSSAPWTPLGPAPLASDASGTGLQDYHQVAGRATAVAIDPADPTGNTLYIGAAQGGIWKSTNAADANASNVAWTPLTDDQATLSIGSIAIQPGNSNLAKTVVLAGTGEANNAADSYFGLGMLRSADGGNTWNLIPTANGGALSFSGLGGTRMAFSTANTAVAAMATSSEGLVDEAITASITRGLYTSSDAGQSWTYNALRDPGNQPTDATSATSVVHNASAHLFLAAVRYHGFYSSPDGVTWTRLTTQPGGTLLSTIACPPQSTSNLRGWHQSLRFPPRRRQSSSVKLRLSTAQSQP